MIVILLDLFGGRALKNFLKILSALQAWLIIYLRQLKTKNAYLISLAVAFKKSAPKTLKDTELEQSISVNIRENF